MQTLATAERQAARTACVLMAADASRAPLLLIGPYTQPPFDQACVPLPMCALDLNHRVDQQLHWNCENAVCCRLYLYSACKLVLICNTGVQLPAAFTFDQLKRTIDGHENAVSKIRAALHASYDLRAVNGSSSDGSGFIIIKRSDHPGSHVQGENSEMDSFQTRLLVPMGRQWHKTA